MYSKIADLTGRYMEPHRRYHTLSHIIEMFQLATEWKVELTEAQVLAIWYHDAIFVPGRTDNESKSIDLLRKHVRSEMVPVQRTDIVTLAERIILDTATHKPTCGGSDLVLDLDMAILGAECERYREYQRGIAKEFTDAVPYEVFLEGRLTFVRGCKELAINKKLFHTEAGNKLNDQALCNLKNEESDLMVMPECKTCKTCKTCGGGGWERNPASSTSSMALDSCSDCDVS